MVEHLNEIKEIKKYALENKVPIMMDDGIDFLTTFIIKNQIKSVLEIGTAIGYSAIMMALSNPYVTITSIERDEVRYLEALKNIKKLNLEDRITLIFKDALDVKLPDKFDLVFIDAAKSQSIRFFEQFSRNLNKNGFILTDNMDFPGYGKKDENAATFTKLAPLPLNGFENVRFENTRNLPAKTINHSFGAAKDGKPRFFFTSAGLCFSNCITFT